MGLIHYKVGDATTPDTSEKNGGIICHVCNDEGAWGSGFVLAVSKKWKQPEIEYRKMSPKQRKVGNYQLVVVGNNLFVANIIGQSGLRERRTGFGVPAVDYAAIETALTKIANTADSMGIDIHMPRIGCFRAGGSWLIMEIILKRVLLNHNCDIYVYDLEKNSENYNK
jgi:O-acetyl-ADP-ribose deacetylase (regulator of RNase III)